MRMRHVAWALAALGLLVAAGIAAIVAATGAPEVGGTAPGEANLPPALAAHLEKLGEALPGNGGEPSEGPGSAEAAELAALAYPDTDIPLARLKAAASSFSAAKGRPFPSGKGRPGSWVSIGPSQADYPFFDGRDLTLYVPNDYLAASRINAMAIAPDCRAGHCRMWVGPAGGGIWRTENALADSPSWKYLSGSFEINSIGAIALDPSNPNTIWVGTGEGNTCGSGCVHGVGLYKSTDGGDTWSGPIGKDAFGGRGMGSIAVDPRNADVVYASSYARGVWRSSDAGATWVQIKPSLNAAITTTLPWIATTKLASGATRMYVGEGNTGSPYSRVFRSDDVATGVPVWSDLTSASVSDPRWGTFNFCTGQCWYDNFVYTPKGYPDVVYVGGSYSYGELTANHRGVVLSSDAGATWTDMTADATDPVHPNALHPDQHALVTNPQNPLQFFEGNDGGVMRSSGEFADRSSWCDSRGLSAARTDRCKQMLSRIPTLLQGINKGLTTLQFQSLSVSPFDSSELQGGTQDNGTWENYHSPTLWLNTMVGDGGQSGFDVADPAFRFHTYFDKQMDVNFSNG